VHRMSRGYPSTTWNEDFVPGTYAESN
jgi:hypothetical protein